MSNQDEKIQELEDRISNLEKRPPEYSGGFAKRFVIGTLAIVLGIFIVLIVIGVFQFVSAK